METGNWDLTIMKKWKKDSHFMENCYTAKFQPTLHQSCMKKWKISNQESLLILNVKTEPTFSGYPHESPMGNFTLPDI